MNDHLQPDHANFISDVSGDAVPLAANPRGFSIKTERPSSPNLRSASLHHFQFQFRSHLPASQSNNNTPEGGATGPASPVYRFGSDAPGFNAMSHPPWPSSSTSSQHASSSADHMTDGELSQNHSLDISTMQHTMSFNDDYDDADELTELPSGFSPVGGLGHSMAGALGEKTVRRRSSKACDQCRKSKCKCERTADNEACRSCIMLGSQCTFLGPSRKRGPPKGYIDAIEARLHQTEALLGIMLASGDDRAKTLLDDLRNDPLANDIINRVDSSPYGLKGRRKGAEAPSGKNRGGAAGPSSGPYAVPKTKTEPEHRHPEFASTHPSNEWQDRVTAMLRSTASSRTGAAHPVDASDSLLALRYTHPNDSSADRYGALQSGTRPVLRVAPPSSAAPGGPSDQPSPIKRQRRRLQDQLPSEPSSAVSGRSGPGDHLIAHRHSLSSLTSPLNDSLDVNKSALARSSMSSGESDGSESESVTDAVGQLSLNEDEQVRYHGKVSGLHLLGHKERIDGRNEGGIWYFPKARVWPPLPNEAREKSRFSKSSAPEDEFVSRLPDAATQEHLLDLYFTYVHPILPVVHKKAFFDVYKSSESGPESPASSTSDPPSGSGSSPYNRRRRRISSLLLLTMFSISARYSNTYAEPLPIDGSSMWAAGDSYLDSAKDILDQSYGSSRASTCQALLLMGYRELGIGAMAQAWIYIGMALRMAQDLGMHRSAEGWARAGMGGRLFSDAELQERRRIWYTCVVMDTYISTYIGRPLAIFDGDFDTQLPSVDEPEEMELWHPVAARDDPDWNPERPRASLVPGRVISCFNASARLAGLLGKITQTIYATRPSMSRLAEREYLERLLDKWYYELPEHLRHEPGSQKSPPPLPSVLTLHMQYWCTVLLLHRPFIRFVANYKRSETSSPQENENRSTLKKSYELCAGAANHITSIVSTYMEHYPIRHASVFPCYYIFTASIMHVTSLATYVTDPQARLGLRTCMDALERMQIVWPSAARALELLRGSKVNLEESELAQLSNHPNRNKRPAIEHLMDTEEVCPERSGVATPYVPPHGRPFIGPGASSVYQAHAHNHGAPSSAVQEGGFEEAVTIPSQSGHPPPPGGGTQYFPVYDRWPAENLQYPSTLSTSVLPQLYSTGLADDRAGSVSLQHHRAHHNMSDLHHASSGHGHPRYPQFWNDYTSFPQLNTAYGLPDPVQTAQPSSSHSHNPASNMYLSDHYNMYNNAQPNS